MGLSLAFSYTNTGTTETDFVIKPEDIQMYDDEGGTWEPHGYYGSELSKDKRVRLGPGEKIEIQASFITAKYGDKRVTIEVAEFADIQGAKWVFALQGGEVRR